MCPKTPQIIIKKKNPQIIKLLSSNIKYYKTIEKAVFKMLNEQNFQLRLLYSAKPQFE